MVTRRTAGRGLILVVALGLAGCATEPVRRFDAGAGENAADWPTWPAAPDIPRFAYAGQLTGEPNYVADAADERSRTREVIAWLVGLVDRAPDPTVLQRPQGGTVDAAGRVLVSDVSRQAVFVFDETAPDVAVWERATPNERFVAPIGVTDCASGGVYVSDAELGLVAHLDDDGNPVATLGKGLLVRPTGIACDRDQGELYVADTRANEIKVLDLAGNLKRRYGRSGDGKGELNAPTYLALSGDRLYVTDTLNARVQVFDRDGRIVETIGKRGLYVGDLTRPKGVAVDRFGHVFVVESYYDHLLVFDGAGSFLMPIGGTGQLPGEFYLPAGVWTDDRDRVYVADMFSGRVSIFQYLGGDE